ncbi:MAG: helix-turn-helix domain-containing protein [Acidimicrobiaceae bacterium]|nr:helix-turn-helix domain-containing protein [Acidimicrobiaceae bacterium]MDE0319653.1 helix-turn-helix domain-containing protein [Acidimicrobiaceae bacterium]MDE0499466.1 helix-turn-helix domain-containing protein [Acidimicrobiaceae bacterium]
MAEEPPESGDDGYEEIIWLSTLRAADRLGITTRTLYRFIDRGDLRAYRFGRVIRLRLSDVDTFMKECRVEPGSLEHLYPEARPDDPDEEPDDPDEEDE